MMMGWPQSERRDERKARTKLNKKPHEHRMHTTAQHTHTTVTAGALTNQQIACHKYFSLFTTRSSSSRAEIIVLHARCESMCTSTCM